MNLFILAVEEPATGSPYTSLILLAVMIGVFWLLIIRPQRKRMKDQQALAESLQIGDDVRTIGGIHGKVISLDETSVVLDIEQGRIRVARRAIGNKVGGEQS